MTAPPPQRYTAPAGVAVTGSGRSRAFAQSVREKGVQQPAAPFGPRPICTEANQPLLLNPSPPDRHSPSPSRFPQCRHTHAHTHRASAPPPAAGNQREVRRRPPSIFFLRLRPRLVRLLLSRARARPSCSHGDAAWLRPPSSTAALRRPLPRVLAVVLHASRCPAAKNHEAAASTSSRDAAPSLPRAGLPASGNGRRPAPKLLRPAPLPPRHSSEPREFVPAAPSSLHRPPRPAPPLPPCRCACLLSSLLPSVPRHHASSRHCRGLLHRQIPAPAALCFASPNRRCSSSGALSPLVLLEHATTAPQVLLHERLKFCYRSTTASTLERLRLRGLAKYHDDRVPLLPLRVSRTSTSSTLHRNAEFLAVTPNIYGNLCDYECERLPSTLSYSDPSSTSPKTNVCHYFHYRRENDYFHDDPVNNYFHFECVPP
ncbi:uncharacterized protein [Aegilops tauschii subsp. strangulata]|uniref:uncharacterized protein n=1 Tax=Aegilops tauschii subsp. strangulata TaxID=200361 RepID=UPI003CC8BFBD